MKNKIDSISIKVKYEVLLTCLCAIGLMIFATRNIASLSIPYIIDDEFGYWGVGAWINGYNWSGVMQYCNYYSYGYGFLLALLIKLAGTMDSAYKLAILLNGFFLIGIFFIVSRLSKEMFPSAPYIVRLGIALIFTLSPNNVYHVNIAWPELLLSFIVWVSLYMLLRFFHSGKTAWLYGLSAVLIYGYMVHNRLLVLMLSLMVVLFFGYTEKKITLKNLLIITAILLAGFFVSQQIKAYFYANLWLNSKVAAAVSFSQIFRNIIGSFSNFTKLLEGFIGKITYFIIATMNMLLINVILCIKVLKQKSKDGYGFVALFILIAFILEIALTSFQMAGVTTNSINMLLYGRYADIFVGSTILFTVYHLNREPVHKHIIITFLISAAISFLSAILSAKVITDNGLTVFGSMNNIYLHLFWDGSKLHLGLASFASCLVGTLIYICIKKPVKKKSFKILFASLLLVNCIWSYSSMNAAGKTVLAFQDQQSYMQNCAAILAKYDEEPFLYLLNGNNIYDNRIKNIMQFLCPEKKIVGQKRLNKIGNSDKIVICSAQNTQILELMFMGYGMVYENNDVIIAERNNITKDAALSNTCWVLGGNGEKKDGHLISAGQDGIFIESRPYLLKRGGYLLETLISIKGDSCTEAGFLYLTSDGMEIARTSIYCKDDQTSISLPFSLGEQSDDFQVHIYLYDGISAEFKSASITPIERQKTALACHYNDPMFLEYSLSGYEIAYAGEEIAILTKSNFSNTAAMQPDNLNSHNTGADPTDDILKSDSRKDLRSSITKATLGNTCWLLSGNAENKGGHLISSGQNGIFTESYPYLLKRGSYVLETFISIKGDPCTEAGFLYLTNDGNEIARTNIYCKDDQASISLPFYIEEQSNDFQVHIYLYDGITAELEGSTITPIERQRETLACRYNDPMFLEYSLSGYEIAYAGEDIAILTKSHFSNTTTIMQPANLNLGGAKDDSTDDFIKSNGRQGIFFETKPYYLEEGNYTVRLSTSSEKEGSSLTESGFIYITENGNETARANIYIDKDDHILTECAFHLDMNSENVIVHIYLYDEVVLQLEELSITKSQQNMQGG